MKTTEEKRNKFYIKSLIAVGLLYAGEIKYDISDKAFLLYLGKDKYFKELTDYLSGDMKEDYSIDEILSGIDSNKYLTEEEKEIFKGMQYVIEDNPFTISKETYYSASCVKVKYGEGSKDGLVGYYIYPADLIGVLEDDSTHATIIHEFIHCLFHNYITKNLPNYFSEGITELLVNEYFMSEPYVEFYSYPFEISMIKLLCNMVGPEKVLEAYTTGDMNIIKNELVNKSDYYENNKEEAAEEFLHSIDRVFTYFEEGKKIPESSFQYIFKYTNEYFINHYDMSSHYMDEFFYYRGILNLLVEEDPYQKYADYVIENGVYARPYFSSKLREENDMPSIKEEYAYQKNKNKN